MWSTPLLVLGPLAVVTIVLAVVASRRERETWRDPSLFEDRTRALGSPILDATLLLHLAQPLVWAADTASSAAIGVLGALTRANAVGLGKVQRAATSGLVAAVVNVILSMRTGLRGRFRIVLFRSFHEPHATLTAKIAAPVLAELGHLTMLSDNGFVSYTPERRGFELLDPASIRDDAGVIHSEDDEWQSKVLRLLRECDAVVLDSSLGSQSLDWERARALEQVPAHRVIEVSSAVDPPPGVISYGCSRSHFLCRILKPMRAIAREASGVVVGADLQLREPD
ncbi:MAG: hypothetical protein KIT84_22820 [Labilithrix sp.]|nr:hypothetical protein [Labilithrix sp.]MCW5813879.1 hypothetical protein [Labilithrix sp.]